VVPAKPSVRVSGRQLVISIENEELKGYEVPSEIKPSAESMRTVEIEAEDMERMKAAVLRGPYALNVEEVPRPKVRPGYVVVNVKTTAVDRKSVV
jgi:hypothetical protein